MEHHIILYTIIIAQACVINVQGMFNANDISMYNDMLRDELNNARKVKNCVLFSWVHDNTNKKTTYTLYKQVSAANESSKIKDETIDGDSSKPFNPINEGSSFLDRDATLDYPDTLELRHHPNKAILTHLILYKEGKIIFNIPLPEDVSQDIKKTQKFILNKNRYPTNFFKNITKTVYHNGWYQEKIYPKRIYPPINMTDNDWHSTWQHYAWTSLKAALVCLIIYFQLFANESLKNNLRLCGLFFVMLIAIAQKIKT